MVATISLATLFAHISMLPKSWPRPFGHCGRREQKRHHLKTGFHVINEEAEKVHELPTGRKWKLRKSEHSFKAAGLLGALLGLPAYLGGGC